jgi:transcriptional regulator with AAA-type ATPase domain
LQLPIPPRDKPKVDARIQVLWHGALDKFTLVEFATACYNLGREFERHLYGDGHEGWRLACVEKAVILNALALCHGNKLETARLLGISKNTLFRRLKEMNNGNGKFNEEENQCPPQ